MLNEKKQLSKLCIHGGVDRIEMYVQVTRDRKRTQGDKGNHIGEIHYLLFMYYNYYLCIKNPVVL